MMNRNLLVTLQLIWNRPFELTVTAQDASIVPRLPDMMSHLLILRRFTYFVCKSAKQDVTVALSGDAGDELLEAIIDI